MTYVTSITYQNSARDACRHTPRYDLKPAPLADQSLWESMRGSPWLAKPGQKCFNQFIETGVLHDVGLRNTLEPDPDNTGVGSFRSRTAPFLDMQLSSLVS